MFRSPAALMFFACLILIGSLICAAVAKGDDFRVDNRVFAGGQKEPLSSSTTIFHQGIVYDTMQSPKETVVLDSSGGRFVLLSPPGKLRAELKLAELQASTDHMRQVARQKTDPTLHFYGDPAFDETLDTKAGVMILRSPWVSYEVTYARPPSKAALEQYYAFSNWAVRLGALLDPHAKPPAARLAVNDTLAKRGLLAHEMRVKYAGQEGSQGDAALRSVHQWTDKLTDEDVRHIQEIQGWTNQFKLVRFIEFCKARG